jgi:multiple sugar transport system substrate-binding protein
MKRIILATLILIGFTAFVASTAIAAMMVHPGKTVEERAINGAKAYVKKHNLKNPTQTMLLISLFKNSQPKYLRQWEKLTGVKIKTIQYGYTDIPAKIMAEAVAKTGNYDVINHFPYVIPDAVGAGTLQPLDAYMAKGKPDFTGIDSGLLAQQKYKGKTYWFILDGDHLALFLRSDIMKLGAAEYKAKFGKEPGCPDTMAEWEQMAKFFHTKKGQTRWGKKFDQPLYGAQAYRSINFSYRHFPAYLGGLLFDKNMNPTVNSPNGIRAIKEFSSLVKYMPPDVQGWGTPQLYPHWGSGRAFSFMSFPSAMGYANRSPKSKISGHQLACPAPAVKGASGKMVRRAPQAAGTGYMVNSHSKHPELGYYFIQWFTGPTQGDIAIADPAGFWDPMRASNLTNKAVLAKHTEPFVKMTLKNAKNAISLLMIEGNYEYFNVLDKNLAQVMQGNISAAQAAKNIEKGWNRITDDIGRKEQIAAWGASVASGAYIDKFAPTN